MMANRRSPSIFLLFAAGIVLSDQIVKAVIVRQIGPGSATHERWLRDDWLGLSYAENSGVAFGMLQGHSTLLLAAATLAVLAAIGFYLYAHRRSAGVWFAGALIAGGAIGNVIDRIRLGYVRDFFSVGPWPQFNVADAAITIGVIIALFSTMKEEQNVKRKTPIPHPSSAESRGVVTDVID
jgi:signal peptidase II